MIKDLKSKILQFHKEVSKQYKLYNRVWKDKPTKEQLYDFAESLYYAVYIDIIPIEELEKYK